MSLHYLAEPHYEISTWFREIFDGLNTQAKTKRLPLLRVEDTFPAAQEEDVLLVIGNGVPWIQETLSHAYPIYENRIILLSSQPPRSLHGSCSLVYSDLSDSMALVFSYLSQYGKSRIALFGANVHSGTDQYRISGFLEQGGKQGDIFFNSGDLAACTEAFLPRIREFDAVICANDYAAVYLTGALKERAPETMHQLFLISYADTLLARSCSPSITSLSMNYAKFGEAVMTIYKSLLKHESYASMHINVQWELHPRESTRNLPFEGKLQFPSSEEQKYSDPFYSDPIVLEMQRVETLLQNMDETDKLLVEALLQGKTYDEMAQMLFLSVNGVKYKLKGMYKICGAESRKEFVSTLRKYL